MKTDDFSSKSMYVKSSDSNGVPLEGNTNNDFYISSQPNIKNTGNDLKNGYVGTFLTG